MSANLINNNSTSQPLVSIVTPSFNQSHFIEKTIRSVIYQDYANLEYFVLDSMSADGTADILNKYSSKITKAIREKDDGQADAINKGLQLAKGEILAYINSDDCYATPHVVSRVVEYFDKNPSIDVVYGKREFVDEKGFYLQSYPFRSFAKDDLVEACFIPQECVFWKRSIYEKAGNKVDKGFNFAMDYDLWLRFLAAGANFLAVDEYFGLFRWYPGQKSSDVWIKHGLPEIARLQEQYIGRALPEDEMIARYQEHWYGVNRLENAKTFTQSVRVWNLFGLNRKALLGNVPRDQWVYLNHLQNELNLPILDMNQKKAHTDQSEIGLHSNAVAGASTEQIVDPFETFEKLIKKTNLFDEKHYKAQLSTNELNLLRHYFENAASNQLDPHILFDSSYYLKQNADVKESGINPFFHWLSKGAAEGRNPHPLFDMQYYLKSSPDLAITKVNPLQHFLDAGGAQGRAPHLLFDAEFYTQNYASELVDGLNPLVHYLTIGAMRCNPHPLFDTAFYVEQSGFSKFEEMSPLEHFIENGFAQKLSPHPDLLYDAYLLSQPGIASSNLNVLQHFLLKGRHRPKFNSTSAVADSVEAELNMDERGEQLFKTLRDRGIYVLREHYFRPMVNPAKLPTSHWTTKSQLPGIEIDVDACLSGFEKDCQMYVSEFRERYPMDKPSDDYDGFYLLNGMYMAVDAHVYWSMVRKLRPTRIIEIGAGNSTMVAADALKLNAKLGSELVVIEPFPDQIVKAGLSGFAKVIESFVEEVDLSVFNSLADGDILFIDSTHVLRQGGDVQHIYCEILPRIKPGVYIHVHDISLPLPYPRTYMEQGLFWTEQYILQAYLSHNSKTTIVWPGNYLMSHATNRMLEIFPEIHNMRAKYPSSEPSAFWFRTK